MIDSAKRLERGVAVVLYLRPSRVAGDLESQTLYQHYQGSTDCQGLLRPQWLHVVDSSSNPRIIFWSDDVMVKAVKLCS